MSNWQEAILSEHIGLRHGFQFRETDFTENGIQVIKIGNVTSDGLSLDANVSYVSNLRVNEFESIIIKDGDILMSLTGNIGRVVEVNNLGNKILFQNYRVGVFYPFKENIFKPFIKWILSSEEILRQLNSNSNQSAQANFGKQDLDKLKFKIPSITEQKKISKILTITEGVIKKTQAAIAKYKAIKQGMLNDLFTRGIDIKTGKLRPKQEDAPDLYKESELGWIPKEWDDGKFIDFADKNIHHSFTGGPFGSDLQTKHYTSTGVRIIQLQNIGDGIFNDDYKIYTSEERANYLINCNIYHGEIIISKMADPIARACIIPKTEKRYLMASDGIRLSIDKKKFNSRFVMETINHKRFRNIAELKATGSTRARIGLTELREIVVAYPEKLEQDSIGSRLDTIENKLQTEHDYLLKLQQIKTGLMADLLSGNKIVTA